MHKKWIVLTALTALLLFVACGCSSMTADKDITHGDKSDMRGNDTGMTDRDSSELNVHHLAALLGMNRTELDSVFSPDEADKNTADDNSRVYLHKMMGGDARISFESDSDDNIEKITVSVKKDSLDRWKSELNSRYGSGSEKTGNMWNNDSSSIRITEQGDNAVITITQNT